jgi:NAD(P)-dependent dehydrogenase (short-subunit alcohol dehydrogenase family)
MKKYMITGGNRGLGLALCQRFSGDSYSRSNGYDITKDEEKIAEASLDYDVFINNAFDGPFHESWANFGQTRVLYAVANAWTKHNKSGTIINIGSTGDKLVVPPLPDFENYRVSKSALKAHSLQWSRAFKENRVPFKTSLLSLDRLNTVATRSRSNWTGNGLSLQEIGNYVELLVWCQGNTCIEEIVAWVNFNYKEHE